MYVWTHILNTHTNVCAQMHIYSTVLMFALNINSNLIWGLFLFAGFLGQRVFSLKFGDYVLHYI